MYPRQLHSGLPTDIAVLWRVERVSW